MNKNKKILKEDLKDIVSKYAGDNILYQLEKEYKLLPNKLINVSLIDDNRFLKQLKLNKSEISNLIDAYENQTFVAPLVVRHKKDHYEVVIGRKRLYAARVLKLEQLHALVGDYSDEEVLLMLLAVARDEHDTNVVEMAFILSNLVKNFHYNQEQLAKLAHLSRTQVTNILRILTLPESIVNDVEKNRLSFGHARCLVTLSENIALELAEQAKVNKLNVRELESLVRLRKKDVVKKQNRPLIKDNGLTVTISFEKQKDKEKLLKFLNNYYGN